MGSGTSSQSPAVHKAAEVPNLKIAVVGDPQAGKTSVLNRYVHNQFSPIYVQTHKAAIENVVRKLNVPGHAKVPVTLWDIPGHEDLPLHSSYFTDLDAVIVVVDISDPASYESATLWRQAVLTTASYSATDGGTESKGQTGKEDMSEKDLSEHNRLKHSRNVEDIPFLLLGNKLDLCTLNPFDEDIAITRVETVEKGDDEKDISKPALSLSEQVQKLEDLAASGFVGAITVSARNNDMSVHAAIQTFLRVLLDKQSLVQRRWVVRTQDVDKGPQTGRPRYKQDVQLKLVGIHEIDAKFQQAEEILYRVTSLQRYQEDSLHKFASQCVDVGVIANLQDASMQNCLVALRDKLAGLDLKLQLKLDSEFLHLEVKASTEDAALDKDIRYAVKTFNKEYAAVTKAMLAEFPVAEKKLSQIEAKIDQLCNELQDQQTHGPNQKQQMASPAPPANTSQDQQTHGPTQQTASPAQQPPANTSQGSNCQTSSTVQHHSASGGESLADSGGVRLGAVVERNRAVLRHTAHECHDCLAHTQRSVKQAKAAFVW